MAKKGQNQQSFWIKAAFIGVSLPLLLSHQSWARNCTKTDIYLKIEQFKDVKKANAALDAVVQCGEDAITPLKQALNKDEATIRANAASTLGKIGATSQDAAPALIAALKDNNEAVRTEAASALIQIGRAAEQEDISQWDVKAVQKLETLQQKLADALKQLEADKRDWASKKEDIEDLRLASNALQDKLSRAQETQPYQLFQWLQVNPWVLVVVVYVVGYVGIFICHPTLLLKLDSWVKPASFTIPWINLPVSLGNFLVLKYNSRVLDAWVKQRLKTAQRQFFKKRKTVSEREIHVVQPVLINDGQKSFKADFKAEEFRHIFDQAEARLLIWGEGGSGKTSLACQMAKWAMWGKGDETEKKEHLGQHRMLPILIEEELDKPLLETIGGLLKDLTQEGKPIPEELLKALLKERRLLVIIDHLSEMGQQTREQIQPENEKFPINALIITSRIKNILSLQTTPTFLQPCRISAGELAGFLTQYLGARGVASKFDTLDYRGAFNRLEKIESTRQTGETENGQQGTTILLVKLYADQMIAAKQGTFTEELFDNVPDLMLQYLNELNRNVTEGKLENTEVHRLAEAVAWKCIEPKFKPEPADYEVVCEALKALEPTAAEPQKITKQQLDYLEKRLSLVRTKELDRQTLRFALDPLAEYLAGLYLIRQYKGNEKDWQKLLDEANDKPGFPEEIRGFLLALRDCCEEKGKKYGVPEWVVNELGKKVGLNLGAIQKVQRKRRVRLLIDDLEAPEPEYRRQAIENLIRIVAEDKATVTLDKAAVTLDKTAVTKAILRSQKILEKDSEVPKVRQLAARLLQQLGVSVPMLVIEIQEGKELLRLKEPPHTTVEDLGNGISLELVEIPEGKFWMGTTNQEEDSRDCERPRHQVRVAPFLMGKYPVTQAQWEVIASLPRVNCDLNSSPSHFKGDHRPVEKISWYSAVEFCQRLSNKTGKKYRLPSEAEWEYACRAGTTSPFHFGETITTDLANYNGNYRYGSGEIGVYHAQTNPVGSFNVVNDFGLYDMHGNVWEWCADTWHDDYGDAPEDGSAWTQGGDDRSPMRGGSWRNDPPLCRSAYRGNDPRERDDNLNVGLRVVCDVG